MLKSEGIYFCIIQIESLLSVQNLDLNSEGLSWDGIVFCV